MLDRNVTKPLHSRATRRGRRCGWASTWPITQATERTFRHDFGARYIRAKVASETVDNTYMKNAVYDGLGFLTSATVLGALTTYEHSINCKLIGE